jgi:hypothetical protein
MALRALAHAGGRVAKRSVTRAGRHAVELTTATHGVRGKGKTRTHALVFCTDEGPLLAHNVLAPSTVPSVP